jgi:hypothetical protein
MSLESGVVGKKDFGELESNTVGCDQQFTFAQLPKAQLGCPIWRQYFSIEGSIHREAGPLLPFEHSTSYCP